ncbi:MAG: hypothetical protein IPJ34_11245 [Myxococcales bacterium]|nr:hypothetical protein [Myxococcales bacterium]
MADPENAGGDGQGEGAEPEPPLATDLAPPDEPGAEHAPAAEAPPADAPTPLVFVPPAPGAQTKLSPEEARALAEKEALYARRRNSLSGGGHKEGEDKPAKKKSRPQGVSSGVKWFAISAIGLGVLGGGAFFGLRYRAESSIEGQVKRHLGSFELAGRNVAGQDAAFAELDKLGAKGVDQVVAYLADTSKIEQDGSRSDRTLQQVANAYLLRLAQAAKADPPPLALEVKKAMFEGQPPPAGKWGELQAAWRGWVDAARGRGSIPKA